MMSTTRVTVVGHIWVMQDNQENYLTAEVSYLVAGILVVFCVRNPEVIS